MLAKLHRVVTAIDLDALIAPILLAIGAEQLWPGSGIFTLGAALYAPLLIETIRGES